jgi:hypothetical protein
MWNDWELHALLNRYNYVSLSYEERNAAVMLTDPPEFNTADTLNYKRVNWGLKNYTVYIKTED